MRRYNSNNTWRLTKTLLLHALLQYATPFNTGHGYHSIIFTRKNAASYDQEPLWFL